LGACHASGMAPGALLQSTPRAWDFRFAPWRKEQRKFQALFSMPWHPVAFAPPEIAPAFHPNGTGLEENPANKKSPAVGRTKVKNR